MRKKSTPITGRIADSLQIPKDLAYREAIFTMTGSRELFIENYKCIRQYEDTCIVLLTKHDAIKIEGTHLTIDYYTNEEMKITGSICCVSFL
ncbi:YabP/YqfC family sporulation protein [Blautia marasmi]|uniref:YabP/YqfC family sporulation protein n=1 Tax=Blautia marasmi TaxID=1917868 RepID=UPI000CF25959|nr:YabP/YqfC family sporulation protein [Blautia marasmi]